MIGIRAWFVVAMVVAGTALMAVSGNLGTAQPVPEGSACEASAGFAGTYPCTDNAAGTRGSPGDMKPMHCKGITWHEHCFRTREISPGQADAALPGTAAWSDDGAGTHRPEGMTPMGCKVVGNGEWKCTGNTFRKF